MISDFFNISMLRRKIVPAGSTYLTRQQYCRHNYGSSETFFLIVAVLVLSILLKVHISSGIGARISLNSILEVTLIENREVLSCYLTGCTALATIGFLELASHLFAYLSGIKHSASFEQKDSGAIMSMISIVPIIAVVFASQGLMTTLSITFAFNNSILCCGHTYLLLKLLGSAYPSIFSKTRSQLLSTSVYLAMIGLMLGFGNDLRYWPNTLSIVLLLVAFVFPTAYLFWQTVLTYDYLNKKFSMYSTDEVYTMCFVCLYSIGTTFR